MSNPGKTCIFDIETDGLLDEVSVMHCAVIHDVDTGETYEYRPHQTKKFLSDLSGYDVIAGHNVVGYDIPVLGKLYGWAQGNHQTVRDTLVLSRLVWPDIAMLDYILIGQKKLEFPSGKLTGSHSLEAWGHRLKFNKGTFGKNVDNFKVYTEDMLAYCRQDVMVTVKLWQKILAKEYSEQAIELEHQFATYLQEQETCGVQFDTGRALNFVEILQGKARRWHQRIISKIPTVVDEYYWTPARDNKTKGYIKGTPILKTKIADFNPASSKHIVRFFKDKYDWQPTVFTKPSKKNRNNPNFKPSPTVSYEVLSQLPYPEAPGLARYRVLMDRIGLIATEKNSWLNCVRKDGRIHGRIIHNGTPTGRCRHLQPNLGNIPAVKSKYGKQCRQYFVARPGFVLLGCDFDGLELRALAHALYPYDGGAFFERAFNGNKEDGTDVHSMNRNAMQATLDAGKVWTTKINDGKPTRIVLTRDDAKTGIYAFVYGAGDLKLGQTFIGDLYPEQITRRVGKLIKKAMYQSMPGLAKLEQELKADVEAQQETGVIPHIVGLDGRMIPVRACFAVLNTYLQSIGAILAKQASVLWRQAMIELLYWLSKVFPVLHVHDELQSEVEDAVAELVKPIKERCFAEAGRVLNVRVPIVGTASLGNNWAETH